MTAALVLVAGITLTLGLAWPGHRMGLPNAGHSPATGQSAPRAGSDPLLVWVTDDGRVDIGNLRTLTSRSIGGADVDFTAPLVPAGPLVYWVKQSGGYVDGAFWPRAVEALNPRTGTSTVVSPGEYVFPAASGRQVYVALTDTSLAELPAGPGTGHRVTQLAVPAGWYLPGGDGLSVADGITVQSRDSLALAHPSRLAVWNPATGRVRPIGRSEGTIAEYTPAGDGYSLLAWMPDRCRIPSCPITITNTVTLSSRTLRSPLGHGFVLGGAFSPNGLQFATFVNAGGQAGGQTAELAIASTTTGALRLIPQVKMTVGEDTDWVRWLPGGGTLVVQGNRDYLVNAATLAARPFRFAGSGQTINFSAELVPPAR